MAITAPRPLVPTRVDAPPGAGRPRRRRRSRVGLVIRIVLAVVTALVMAFPLWVMLTTAFSGQSTFDADVSVIPRRFSLDNFARVFEA